MDARTLRKLLTVTMVGALVTALVLVGCLNNVDNGALTFDGGGFPDFDTGALPDVVFAPDTTVVDSGADVTEPLPDASVNPADTAPPPKDSAVADVSPEASAGDAGAGEAATDAATAITDLAATGGPEDVTLTWTAVPGATGYNLYEATSSGDEPALGSPTTYVIPTTGTTALSSVVPDLTAGAVYYFFLTALDAQGTEILAASNEAHATVLPLPPVVVTTTPGNKGMTLTWNSVQQATSYNVYYSTSSSPAGGTKVASAVSGVAIPGVPNDQLYYFGVTAVASGTEGPMSNVVSGTGSIALAASIANLRAGGVVHSGAVVGRASGTGLTAVQVSIDGAAYVAATGTASWSFPLPTGSGTWREGSLHTIAVRATDGAAFSPVATVSVRKGVNQDVDGDGYADVVVGSPSDSAAYVFASSGATGVASGPSTGAPTKFTGPSGSGFGGAITLGDLNGDGYADVIVGTNACNNNTNQVYIFESTGSPVMSQPADGATATLTGLAATCFGTALATGDVDGDGFADLVVGAQGYTVPVGTVYVFKSTASGVANGDTTSAATTLTGATLACTPACPLDQFGAELAVGDVNGDGYADVAVASLQSGGTNDEMGSVFVFQSAGTAGIPSALYSAAQTTLTGAQPIPSFGSADDFGASIAMGDMNGDGFADVIVGASQAASTNPTYWDYTTGAVYVFDSAGTAGIANASYASATTTFTGILHTSVCCSGDRFGYAVAVGDINADGYADLVATATSTLQAYVFQSQGAPLASSATPAGAQTVLRETGGFGSTFGSVAAIGDPNGDGYADIVLADSKGGLVYVFESAGSPVIASGDVGTASTVLSGTLYDFGSVVGP